MREVVRYRKNMIDERSREINRLEKTLEGANIKLSSFVSDLNGVSSRKMLEQALIGEVDESNIDSLIHHSMKEKREALLLAMEGVFSPTLKFLARNILEYIDDLTRSIKNLDDVIDEQIESNENAIRKNAGIQDIT
ncbi:MAG: IS110 family transposase [Firmicutes bacterium]|nr:IS110 family transposase [Bacillota bacterium]